MVSLSLVLIGFNVSLYVAKCINAILPQMDSNCELIFVDDGSTDGTSQIVLDLFKHACEKKCRYIHKENSGANAARVYGYTKARGKYIAFIDSDDWVEPDYISAIYKCIERSPDIITFGYQTVCKNGDKVRDHNYNSPDYTHKQFLKEVLECKISHYFWDKVYSYEFLKKIKFEDIPFITMGDDLAAHIRMGICEPYVINLDMCLYNYYNDGTGISRKPSSKTAEILVALEDIAESLNKANLGDTFAKQLDYHYFRSFLFYVVKNKYAWSDVQEKIYKAWKKKSVHIYSNPFILEYMKSRPLEMLLAYLYNINRHVGLFFSKIYLLRHVKGKGKS